LGRTEEGRNAGTALDPGKNGLEGRSESGVDPSINQRVVGCVSRGEPVRSEDEVDLEVGRTLEERGVELNDKVYNVFREPC
jgi:hypothetical protein